jgi:hypothetical protein
VLQNESDCIRVVRVSKGAGIAQPAYGLASEESEDHSRQRQGQLWSRSSLLSSGHRGIFDSRVKRPGREAGHSPPTNVEL